MSDPPTSSYGSPAYQNAQRTTPQRPAQVTNTANLARQIAAYLDDQSCTELQAQLAQLALQHLGIYELLQRLSPSELKTLAERVPLTPQMAGMLRSSLYTLALERQTQPANPFSLGSK